MPVLLFFLMLALLPATVRAEPADEAGPHITAMRRLSVNRSLLTRAEAEYRHLQQEEERDPSDATARKLENLRYKIQALKDDAERLQGGLPDDLGAGELLKEMVERQQRLGQPSSPVDVAAEKTIARATRRLYHLHEKALAYVAEDRFEAAAGVYEEILLLSPDDDEAYLLLGHSRLAAAQYRDAAQAFRNAIHIDPKNLREIPRLYENVLLENPSDDEAMAQLGYAHLLLGHAKEARTAFEEALKLNPSNDPARRGLFEVLD